MINLATGNSKTKWNEKDKLANSDLLSPGSNEITLSYSGKQTESEILSTPPAAIKSIKKNTLLKSGGNDNRLFWGDNFGVLAYLLQDHQISKKVRLVYIDPPFATRSVFQSRNQNDAYHDLLFGADYLEFLRKRLIFLREILAADGSIYLHLDENMAFYAKVIMDEIFGKRNFRNWITRKKCNPKNYTRKTYGNVNDYILFYTKTDKYVWNRPFERWSIEKAQNEYQYVEHETGRRYKKVPVHAPGTRNGETGKLWKGNPPPPGKHWQYTPDKLNKMDATGDIYWSPNGNPRRKFFLDDSEGIPIQDIWLDFKDAHNQNIKISGYPTEKNPDLVTRIIGASSNQGDIVLDCFSGSGTTLSMASKLGRRWIGIDNSPEAILTTLKRFKVGVRDNGGFCQSKKGFQESSA